jgi:hypothetical protein
MPKINTPGDRKLFFYLVIVPGIPLAIAVIACIVWYIFLR